MSGLLAVLLAGGAAALAVGGRPDLLAARLGTKRRGSRSREPSARAIDAVRRIRHRAVSTRDRGRRQREVVDACLMLASTMRIGVPARQALAIVAADWPSLFGAVARRAAIGDDVPIALRAASTMPGCGALAGLAAGWEVSERTGAALSDVIMAVADSLRGEAAVRREADAQLATVRATSRLLAVLPVGTLILLSGGGGRAMDFLLGSWVGLACLSLAAALVGSGMWWIHVLARSAVRSPWG